MISVRGEKDMRRPSEHRNADHGAVGSADGRARRAGRRDPARHRRPSQTEQTVRGLREGAGLHEPGGAARRRQPVRSGSRSGGGGPAGTASCDKALSPWRGCSVRRIIRLVLSRPGALWGGIRGTRRFKSRRARTRRVAAPQSSGERQHRGRRTGRARLDDRNQIALSFVGYAHLPGSLADDR